MTPELSAVYDELLERATAHDAAERTADLRETFWERSGRFELAHPAREARERAAWDYALVRGGLAALFGPELADGAERSQAARIARGHRGLFAFHDFEGIVIAEDVWSRAQFILSSTDDLGRALLAQSKREESLCDAYVVAVEGGVTTLPGALFHPVEARPLIEQTIESARRRGLTMHTVLDALLRMEHALQTLSRVSVRYAYRAETVGL